MGCWGMGITQSDEFCEIYDGFMEAYDEGKEIEEITRSILEEYHREFSDDEGVMHDVYFALAKAQWMCGQQSPDILCRVKEIIEAGDNLAFYSQLGASEPDLKLRKRKLDKFWADLQSPRPSPRKRKKKAAEAAAEEGMVFWYRSKGALYGALVLEIMSNGDMLVALSESLSAAPKTPQAVLDSAVYTAAWFCGLLPASRVHTLGLVEAAESYNGRAGMYHTDIWLYCENEGTDTHWAHEGRRLTFDGLKMGDLLNPANVPADFRHPEQLEKLLQENRPVICISLQ